MSSVCAALFAALVVSAPARTSLLDSVPDDGKLSFTVLRDGKSVGSHFVEFHREGANLMVLSRTDINVWQGSGIVPFFRYASSRVEIWTNGQLAAFEAETEKTGEDEGLRVRAMALPDGLVVQRKEGHEILPKTAMPATMWNPAALSGALLFDPDDGHVLEVERKAPPLVKAASADTERVLQADDIGYRLSYDAKGIWMGLKFRARDGASIEYVKR